jgi:hypothetical protein
LRLEREAFHLSRRLVDLESHRVRAVEEGIAMAWTADSRRCLSKITGRVYGCLGDPLPGFTLRIVDHFTLEDYGTFTTDEDGDYVAEFKTAQGGGGLDLYPGPAPRLDDTDTAGHVNVGFNRCGSISYDYDVDDFEIGADYICEDFCNWPISKTLHCTDPFGGPFACVWDGSTSWIGCHSVAYPGGVFGCAALTTAYRYQLQWNGSDFVLSVRYPAAGLPGNSCPTAGSCPPTGSVNNVVIGTAPHTCPAGPSAKFSASVTLLAGHRLYPAGGTITFEEP